MPLGIARLNTLARYIAEAVSEGDRTALSITAFGDAQIDTAENKFGGASGLFDGTGDGLNLGTPVLPATADWTVEMWVYPTSTPTATDYFFSQYSVGSAGRSTFYHTTGGNVGLFINGGPNIVTTSNISTNSWTHIAWVRNGSSFKIYIDGTEEGSGTGSPSIQQSQNSVVGAQDSSGTNGFIGNIDEIRISDNARYTSNFTPSTTAFSNDSNTLGLIHCDGADGSTTFTDDTSGGASPSETYEWTYWDGTNNGSVVVAHDDTVSSDGTTRHRVTMFDDTYGVVSYDKGSDTVMYWRQFSVADTTITLGSENSISALNLGSHTTAQYAITVNNTKAIHGYANGARQIDYAVFTLSGSTVSASGSKSESLGTTESYAQHCNINKLDTDTFVIDGQTACAVLSFNNSTDTLTFEDEISYTGNGNYGNVSLYFTAIDTSKWMFAGANTSSGVSAQVYQYSSGSISTVGSASTYSIPSGYTSMSRAIQNPTNQNNTVIAVALTNSSTNALDLTPVKYDTGSSSISIGSTYTYTPSAGTYFRVDNSIWNGDTLTGIYGGADNRNYGISFDYDNATNTISASSNATEHELSEDTGYIFQGYRSARIDDERAVFAWTESGVDTSGDLQLRVLKGNVAPAAGGGIVYRTDTYASNVYLALPFDSSNELNDVSPSINGSSTQATLTSGANSSVTNAEVYWTSTPDYNKALENIATSGVQSMAYGLSTSIPSSASGTYVIEGWFLADDATTNGNWAISSADSGGRLLLGVNSGTGTTFGNENRVGIGSGWHHLAMVCDSGTKRFYTDGVYKGAWVSSNTGFSTLHIGQFNAGDNNDFQGHIQDFRVTIGSNRGYTGTNSGSANFTLPQSIVESGIPTPTLSRPYTITPLGSAEVDTAVTKYGTGSLLPNGSRLEVEMDMPSSDFTIEGWYRINNRSAVSGLWEIRDDSNPTHRLALYGGEAGGGFKVLYLTYVDESGTEQIDIVTPTNTFPDTTWKHCAVTKNGNTFTVWIDGVDRGNATYSSFTMPTTTTFNLGGAATNGRYFRGNVDEFRMSDTVRYTSGFTAPTGEHSSDSNTLLLVHMNGADGSTSFTDDNT